VRGARRAAHRARLRRDEAARVILEQWLNQGPGTRD
jgi:hypothetical protein